MTKNPYWFFPSRVWPFPFTVIFFVTHSDAEEVASISSAKTIVSPADAFFTALTSSVCVDTSTSFPLTARALNGVASSTSRSSIRSTSSSSASSQSLSVAVSASLAVCTWRFALLDVALMTLEASSTRLPSSASAVTPAVCIIIDTIRNTESFCFHFLVLMSTCDSSSFSLFLSLFTLVAANLCII